MRNHFARTGFGFAALALVIALAFLLFPHVARADDPPVTDKNNLPYAGLEEAIRTGESPFTVIGETAACTIPSNVTVEIAASGKIDGDLFNYGTLTGVSDTNCGTIYDYTGNVTGGKVRVAGSAVSGASEVRFLSGASETADYQNGILWIPRGTSIQYLIINDYVCTPNGGRIQYAITYLYNNTAQSAMKLDTKKYPATYCVKTVDQTIPEAPDTEVDFVFAGWYCKILGYEETNLQKTLVIPANRGADLTLLSWWTESPGHNEGRQGASGGMAGGMAGGMSGSGSGGLSGGIRAMADTLTNDDNKDEDNEAAAVLTDYSASQGGGMRVRNASSTTRHTFDSAQNDVEARANARAQKRFPWQWVGAGLGGALILLAIGVTVRRKMRERNEATLEKLHIRD